jgi:hypothetical protein
MEMWIHGNLLCKERASVSTDKQQTFSMVTGGYISGRAEKKRLILYSSFVLSDS